MHEIGGRAAIAVGDKVFIAMKNKTLQIFETPSLKRLSEIHTDDVIRKFHLLSFANSEGTPCRHLIMTIGCQIWILNADKDKKDDIYKGRISLFKDKASMKMGADAPNIIFDLKPTPCQNQNTFELLST
jgi:hypothetical protein